VSDLTELLRHMADDAMGMEPGDRQVLSEAANRIEALEAQLKAVLECPRFSVKLNSMKLTYAQPNKNGEYMKSLDILKHRRRESEPIFD
jgi:hypothetical protein